MKLYQMRFVVQSISFAILTYGGRIGLQLGHFLPCFSCPYVGGCAGHCYLMALQGSIWGLQIPAALIISSSGLGALGMFIGFSLLVLLLSKSWCGWICPFGALQDGISFLRKKLGIRESQFSWGLMDKLKSIKYILLIILIVVPILIANVGLHPDFTLPFCQICPEKLLMPVFEWNFKYFAINTINPITIIMSLLSISLTAFFLVGMFFKDRFFCIFCPLLALMSAFDKIGFVRFNKKVDSCAGCGNCQRVCPVDIRRVHLEKEKENVLSPECMECFKCVEACPQDKTLSVKWLKWTLFSSSRKYVGKLFIK